MRKQVLVAILLLSLLVPVFSVHAAGGEMTQVLMNGRASTLHNTDNRYGEINAAQAFRTSAAEAHTIISTDGVLRDLRIVIGAAPGVGKSFVFTLYLNDAPTALTATISDAATMANDTAHAVTVTGGDVVYLVADPDGIPTTSNAWWSLIFEATNAKESLITGSSGSLDDAVTEYLSVMGAGTSATATEADRRQVIPTAGTISNLYVELTADPGNAPDAYRFTLRKGGASQILTVTITADATTGSDTTHEVSVAAGDIVTLMVEPLNGPAVEPYSNWGMTFTANIDKESIVMGCLDSPLDTAANDYMLPIGYASPDNTEANRRTLAQDTLLSKLYLLLSAAPSAGDSYTFTLRNQGVSTGVDTYILGIATTGNSGNDVGDIENSEYLTLESTPASTPDAATAYWGFVMYSGPPEPTNDACDSDAVFSRNHDGWVNVTVSDYLIDDLATVDIQVNTTNDYENFTLRWTQAGDTFSELSDLDNICTLNTTLSTRVNIDDNTDQICFYFTMTSGTSGDCDVTVTTTDDEANTDIDTYNAEFEFSYYSWDELVYDWIDSAFEQFGVFNYMTQITTFLNGLATYFEDSLTHLLALIVQQFRVITNVYNFAVFWTTELIGIALDFSTFYQSVIDGTSGWDTGIGDFWGVIEYDLWAPIVPLMLFLWWLESLSKRGAQTVGGELQVFINDMNTGISILSYFVGMFSFVVNTIIDRAYGLFDAIV